MDDGPGADIPANLDKTPDAVPVIEPLGKFANRPYNVFGVDYVPHTDLSTPYRQRGMGSWYGRKFHGQKTSSGEIYDMFAMTAAHPTLPIPSYVRVTNVKNGQSVIVRVNDRGPFLHSRIIDLSYTAAYKLGYVGNGSAELEVEKFTPELIAAYTPSKAIAPPASLPGVVPIPAVPAPPVTDPIGDFAFKAEPDINPVAVPQRVNSATVTPESGKGFYLQLGSFGVKENAENMVRRLSTESSLQTTPLSVAPNNKLFRVLAGPFVDRLQAQAAAQKIQSLISFEPLVLQP